MYYMYARECYRSCSHMARIKHKGCFEKMMQCLIFKYLSNQVSDFQMFFFPLKTETHMQILNTKLFLCNLRGQDVYKTKCGS